MPPTGHAMERNDLFPTAHLGIRRILFETALAVTGSDLADPAEGERTAARLRRLFGSLREHDDAEDEVVLPTLSAVAPALAADLRIDHARLEGLQRELESLLSRLDAAAGPQRASLGRRIEDRLGRLVAAHLLHLSLEESEVERVLHAHCDDAARDRMRARLDASAAALLPRTDGAPTAERRERSS